MSYKIPFNRPYVTGAEQRYLAEAIALGHLSGDGTFTKRCSQYLEQRLAVPKALLTTSCTHALEMTALLLDLKEGDEVIVPSFTFVSTVNAFVLRGAKPIFADVREDTLNLDEKQLRKLITPKTKAIVPVHYAGVACEMDEIETIAAEHNISIVEDNAHGLFGKYKGKALGTFGRLATQSFHETKNLQCGEGGALIINDQQLIERAEIIREKGTNRSRFFRGQVDKYTWVDVGSSYLISDILGAFLLAQLEASDQIQQRRKEIWDYYSDNLQDCSDTGIRLPVIPEHCDQSYHMFYILLPTLEVRQNLIAYFKERGILSVYHYQPLHNSDYGRLQGGTTGQCPVTESIADRLLRLPFYFELSQEDQARVVRCLKEFLTSTKVSVAATCSATS